MTISNSNKFKEEMEKRGFVYRRSAGSWFHGVSLRPRPSSRYDRDDEDNWGGF